MAIPLPLSGLPLQLEDNKLVFGEGVKEIPADIRTMEQMKPALKSTENSPEEHYYMYRGVCLKKDDELIDKNGLRYDITVLVPGKSGDEHIKTLGHFHPVSKPGLTFPEIYEVIYGEATYILQKEDQVIIVKAKAGDTVKIPPNFGHVTINSGVAPLVMANILEKNFKSIYEDFVKNKGAMYIEQDGKLVKNENWGEVPEAEFKEPSSSGEKPLYEQLVEDPKKFEYLKNPELI